MLGKIIFPVTVLVSILKFTPVIDWVILLFKPLMVLFGLPGEAAIPLALGNLLNLYAAIGGILSLDLTVKEVFILAVMLSFSHNLLIETVVARKIGIKAWVVVLVRLGLAAVSAIVINLLWRGGAEKAVYGMIPEATEAPETWIGIFLQAIETALMGIVQLSVIVIPLMIGIQILKDINAIRYLARGMSPFTRMLGVSSNTAVTLMAGLMFGLAFGAGVIIQTAREENLSKKDLYLLTIFLVACHAVVEDTLLFVPLGINVLPLLLIRLVVAFVITMITARIWERYEIHTGLKSNQKGHTVS
ncbi:MAG: hypothetical protein H0Z33_15040 [Bacillaceae bacterium]|nr:hypothetical protein [Bacillaceae bacterium]